MSKKIVASIYLTLCLSSIIANAFGQNTTDRSRTCCSNAVKYAFVMVEQLNDRCAKADKPLSQEEINQIIYKQIKKYIKKVESIKNKGKSNQVSCYGNASTISPFVHHSGNLSGRDDVKIDAGLCFDPKVLLPEFSSIFVEGLHECKALDYSMPVVSNIFILEDECECKHDITCNCVCDDCKTSNNYYISNKSYNYNYYLSFIYQPPLSPQVPTEPILSTGITSSIRAADTRAGNIQIPLVMSGDSDVVPSIGSKIRPFVLWNINYRDIIENLPDDYLTRAFNSTWFAFGLLPTRTDGAKHALVLGYDLFNDMDILLNPQLKKCINRIFTEQRSIQKNSELDDVLRKLNRDCYENSETNINYKAIHQALSLNFAWSEELIRPSLVADYVIPKYKTSFSPYANMYFLNHDEVKKAYFIPLEIGSQIGYANNVFSAFMDLNGSVAVPFAKDTIIQSKSDYFRFSYGIGTSIALHENYISTFGIKYMPKSWLPDDNESGIKVIVGLGWAGYDTTAQLIRKQSESLLENKSNTANSSNTKAE